MSQDEITAAAAIAEHTRFVTVITSSKDDLVAMGFNEITFEDFYEVITHFYHCVHEDPLHDSSRNFLPCSSNFNR
jgi:hypothetical protein